MTTSRVAVYSRWSDPAPTYPYAGLIKVYTPAGALRTLPDGSPAIGAADATAYNMAAGTSYRIMPLHYDAPPWFVLATDGGVMQGEVRISVRHDWLAGVRRIHTGDRVEFWPDAANKWCDLWCVGVEYEEFAHVYRLAGLAQLHLHGWPAVDPGAGAITLGESEDIGGHVRDLINDRYDNDPVTGVHKWGANQTQILGGGNVSDFEVDDDSDVAQVLADLAAIQQGQASDTSRPWTWGIDTTDSPTGRLYFRQRPDVEIFRYARNGTAQASAVGSIPVAVLNVPRVRESEFFNVLDIRGGSGYRAVKYDSASLATYGQMRFAREDVPTITSDTDAARYAAGYFARFANPTLAVDPIEILLPSAAALPLPWGGYGSFFFNGNLTTHTIKRVRVRFDAQPIAEITLGDLEQNRLGGVAGSSPWAPGVPDYAIESKRRRRGSGGGGTTYVQTIQPAYTGTY